MSSMEEVEAAEAKMNSAKDALMNCVEGKNTIDADLYRKLVAQLKRAEAEFTRAISELGELSDTNKRPSPLY